MPKLEGSRCTKALEAVQRGIRGTALPAERVQLNTIWRSVEGGKGITDKEGREEVVHLTTERCVSCSHSSNLMASLLKNDAIFESSNRFAILPQSTLGSGAFVTRSRLLFGF